MSSCHHERAKNYIVDAESYDSFWLWAGVKPQPVLDTAKRIYILAGEIRAAEKPVLSILRPATPKFNHADLWLVLRVETLQWTPEHYEQFLSLAKSWEGGNKFAGVQIDFDARTRSLGDYAEFLKDLRRRLPEHYALSVTGLLDWSANGDPAALAAMAGTIDEAVFQVYQGRTTISVYTKWLDRLDKLPMPFRIGLVQGGEWKAPKSLANNPNFRGYVVFLLNEFAPSKPAS